MKKFITFILILLFIIPANITYADVIFEPELQRCISVDIRYVLWVIDKFGGAGHLVSEMTIAK